MRSRIRAISLALLSALIAPTAAAPNSHSLIPPSWYQDLHWRFIGPFRGGRVLTVAGIPGDSRHFWFGAVDGGVWATNDSGRSWSPIFDSQPEGSIGAVTVVPSKPNMICVGTGEADMRSDIAHGNGVYKTTDGGAHWSFLGLADTRQIGRILVNPKNPNIVFIAALGHAYSPNSERGVFRSTDGGAHWSRVLFKDENTGAISELSGVPVPGSVRADRTTAPPPLNSLKNLSDELGELQNTVDGADADPSPDARAAYITLSRALGSKLQQWQQLKTSDVVRFDRGAKGQ